MLRDFDLVIVVKIYDHNFYVDINNDMFVINSIHDFLRSLNGKIVYGFMNEITVYI